MVTGSVRTETQMTGPDRCVILFLKHLVRGQVKTRLAAVAGDDVAVDLYRRFVEDMVSMLDGLDSMTCFYYHGASGGHALVDWLGRERSYIRQRGDDLGRRMANAFRNAFARGFTHVVLIGSDLPDLPADFIREAFAALKRHDAVIGPSTDGGYYLIGFTARSFLPEAFEGISWGTDRVFGQTMEVLHRGDVKTFVLPRWRDIDTWADLSDLIRRNRSTSFSDSRTWVFLRRCGWTEDMEGNEMDV